MQDLWHPNYLLDWVKSYLVSICNHTSILLPVKSGVPQGSIIGPIAFLVDIDDLASHYNTLMFADDSQYYKHLQLVNNCLALHENMDSVVSR